MATDISGAPASEATEVSSSPRIARLLVLIWVRPQHALRTVAAGPHWVWAVPLSAAALLLYLRFLLSLAMSDSPAPASMLASGLMGITLGWLLRALILWKMSAALGGGATFAVIYRLSAWAAFPLILRGVIQIAYTLATGAPPAGEGLAALMPQPGNTPAPALLYAILSRVDLYTLWFLALLFMALKVGASLTRTRAALVVGCYSLLTLVPILAAMLLDVSHA